MLKDNTARKKYDTSQLLNFAQDSYLERTSRPIYALMFLLPFILFYELGTILINTDVLNQSQVRVVAFVWMQNSLEYLGFGSRMVWAMPAVTVVIILAALQFSSRKRWFFSFADILPMTIECTLWAVPLIVLSLFLNSPGQRQNEIPQYNYASIQIQTKQATGCPYLMQKTPSAALVHNAGSDNESLLANLVTSIGAGIYEELVFRLILICTLMILLQNILHLSHRQSIILSVLVSAALFSAHHHILFLDGQITQSSPFTWEQFAFRTIAGVYFAVLFAVRGFGITAGTHAFYDIIAVFINSIFYAS